MSRGFLLLFLLGSVGVSAEAPCTIFRELAGVATLTENMRELLPLAQSIARDAGHAQIQPTHLLLAELRQKEAGPLLKTLTALGHNKQSLMEAANQAFNEIPVTVLSKNGQPGLDKTIKTTFSQAPIADADVVAKIILDDQDGVAKHLPKKLGDVAELIDLAQVTKAVTEKIVGQPEAKSALIKLTRRLKAGLNIQGKPLGSFLFPGESGTGKTHSAKVFAEALYGDKDAYVKINMAEFSEKHTVARFFGAPSGYAGYDDTPLLGKLLRENPRRVIVLDEIEKAHPDILNFLLGVLDDGKYVDNKGVVQLNDTVIVLTTNLGQDIPARKLGKEAEKEFRDRWVEAGLRKEVLNRVGETVFFKPLNAEEVGQMTNLVWKDIAKNTKGTKDLKFQVSEKASKLLTAEAKDGFSEGREIEKVITKRILDPLADLILDGKIQSGQTLKIDVDDLGKITVNP